MDFARRQLEKYGWSSELTVPWKTNIPKDHTIKLNKYYDLTNELTKNGYAVNLYAVEVGARGIPAKSLYNLLKDLGLSRTAVSSILERASKAALAGKGLGKHEDGISEALKPKLKRSVTGIGHDAAAEFNEHWWSALYDKAAKNVEVEDKNGKTKRIKTVDSEDFTITNSTWRINKKHKNNEGAEYSEYFVKKAVLTNDGTKAENVSSSDSESDTEKKKKDVFKMTDEELFKACEGRTAHKGARHGLKALGKLARIEQQEQMLLTQSKYEGYSHAKKLKQKNEEIFEDTSVTDNQEEKQKNKKKKKKKRRLSNENESVIEKAESEFILLPEKTKKIKNKKHPRDTSVITNVDNSRNNTKEQVLNSAANTDNIKVAQKKRKKQIELIDTDEKAVDPNDIVEKRCDGSKKKKKKKKLIEVD